MTPIFRRLGVALIAHSIFVGGCAQQSTTPLAGQRSGGPAAPFVVQQGSSQQWISFPILANITPGAITVGPNKNIWFTDSSNNYIDEMSMRGQVLQQLGAGIGQPSAIVSTARSLFVATPTTPVIARVQTNGAVTTYAIPSGKSAISLIYGPDKNIWFTTAASIGRLIFSGPTTGITEYAVPTPGANPQGITAARDGKIWFTEQSANKIGRIDPTNGAIVEYPLNSSSCGPEGIIKGPNKSLWFSCSQFGVGQITLSGTITLYAPTVGPSLGPSGIAYTASDRSIWVATGVLNRISSTGTVTTFSFPWARSGPVSMVAGPDGNLWMTNGNASFIGVFVRLILTVTPNSLNFTGAFQAKSVSVSETQYTGTWSAGSSDETIATVTAGNTAGSFVVTAGQKSGSATVTISDSKGNFVGVPVTVTLPGPLPNYARYILPTANAEPMQIALGSDGALWFTENQGNAIGRISMLGSIAEYAIPTTDSGPVGITAGSDGALWFTEQSANQIGRIATNGLITQYLLPTADSGPHGITAGQDGALWFTEQYVNAIGRISTLGLINEYPIPTANAGPVGITTGPDGALWFTEGQGLKVGRITVQGAISEFPLGPSIGGYPSGIASGSDGALWFCYGTGIGRMDTSGGVTAYPLPPGNAGAVSIASGPDGALWFGETKANQVGTLTTQGVLTEYAVPTADSYPLGVAFGPDNALWFTELSDVGNAIGRYKP